MYLTDPVTVYNTKVFPVRVSGYYEPVQSWYCKQFKVPPPMIPEQARQRAMYSTAVIVDAAYDKERNINIEFESIEHLREVRMIILAFLHYVEAAGYERDKSTDMACKKCHLVLPGLTLEYERWLNYLLQTYPNSYDHLRESGSSLFDKVRSWLS